MGWKRRRNCWCNPASGWCTTSNERDAPQRGPRKTTMTDTSKQAASTGTGKRALPMSALVAKAGYAVTAFDQSAARLAEAKQQGVAVAASPAEAVNGKPVVITSLPD